jgi:hypothetical protein
VEGYTKELAEAVHRAVLKEAINMTQSLRMMGAHCCVLDHSHIMVERSISGPLKPAAFDLASWR